MIVFPKNWNAVGRRIGIKEIDNVLNKVIWGIDCNALSFSGGLDSSLLLWHMCMVRLPIAVDYSPAPIRVFTATRSWTHPDFIFANKVVEYFRKKYRHIDFHSHTLHIGKESEGNGIKLFYEYIAERTDSIIAGDGIDEFMCGYYDYQTSLDREGVYYDRLRRLQKDHLIPLNENSGKVKVYLPYIDESLISLYSQIPLKNKVDDNTRKKVMVAMAKGKVPDEILTRRKYGFCDVV